MVLDEITEPRLLHGDLWTTNFLLSPGRWRALVYRARHLGAVRLERHRLGNTDGVAASYLELRAVLDALAA
ncbi:hypothetical protein [Amycolatopsis thermoflava]|uniref:hypothetical protein n=1 Tax=Amycolatopsis thermoflava TaxID=84480 RepID=UPI00381BB0A1